MWCETDSGLPEPYSGKMKGFVRDAVCRPRTMFPNACSESRRQAQEPA
jgi:hypothetical protein